MSSWFAFASGGCSVRSAADICSHSRGSFCSRSGPKRVAMARRAASAPCTEATQVSDTVTEGQAYLLQQTSPLRSMHSS